MEALERLMLMLRPDLPRRLTTRERRVELLGAVGFFCVAAALVLLLPSERTLSLPLVGGLVLFHAACAHIRLYVGGGFAMPTGLALVTMLFFLPAGAVPLAVAGGLALAVGLDVLRRAAHPERLLTGINDAWHAVGPALVIYAAGEAAPTMSALPLLVPILGAQFAVDVAAATLREWAGRGIRPQLQLAAMGWVCALDLMLAPIGLLAAFAAHDGQAAWLLAAPLALLLGILTQDRRRRIEETVAHVEELRRERERLQEVLRRAGKAFALNLDRDALLAAVTDTAAEALLAEVSWTTDTRPTDPFPAALLADDGRLLERAMRDAVAAARTPGAVATAMAGDWHAIACPLPRRRGQSETIALGRRTPFSHQEQELLAHLGTQAGMSVENAELHERLREQAKVDDLTGLANHRRFQDVLARTIDDAEQTGEPVGVIMLDLDELAAINRAYGHEQGDTVLRLVGRAVRDCCRHFDLPARFGGQKIAVLVPGGDLDETHALAERLRQATAELRFPLPHGDWHQLTLSAGIASYPSCAPDRSSLLAAAEDALYAAKRAGKNRAVRASVPLVHQ